MNFNTDPIKPAQKVIFSRKLKTVPCLLLKGIWDKVIKSIKYILTNPFKIITSSYFQDISP